jgi:hypothetical protein
VSYGLPYINVDSGPVTFIHICKPLTRDDKKKLGKKETFPPISSNQFFSIPLLFHSIPVKIILNVREKKRKEKKGMDSLPTFYRKNFFFSNRIHTSLPRLILF